MGWQIFSLREIVQSGQTDLGSAQIKEVRKKLYQKQTNARFEEWLSELRSKSIINILL
jgi:hypothetical protein